MNQWIGRENLQETRDFPIKYGAVRFSCQFSLKPVHWMNGKDLHGGNESPSLAFVQATEIDVGHANAENR